MPRISVLSSLPVLLASLIIQSCGAPGSQPTEPAAATAATTPQALPAIVAAMQQPFTPNDITLTSETFNLSDHEFDFDNHRMAFIGRNDAQSGKNWVYVADLDPATGNLLGDPRWVDTSGLAIETYDTLPFGNGPEWAASQRGYDLYYLKAKLPERVPYMVRASQPNNQPSDPWVRTALLDTEWKGPNVASYNVADPNPFIVYMTSDTGGRPFRGAWRVDTLPVEEFDIPQLELPELSGAAPGRIVPGRREIVLTVPDASDPTRTQMARLHLEYEDSLEVITSYGPDSIINSVSIMPGPVSANGDTALLFYCIVNNHHIDVYSSTQWGQYTLVNSGLRPPVQDSVGYGLLLDDENFVLDGQPFITITMGNVRRNPPDSSQIWFAWAYATDSLHYRKVSANVTAVRNDPEPLKTGAGTFIYYREKVPTTNNFVLHKADIGL